MSVYDTVRWYAQRTEPGLHDPQASTKLDNAQQRFDALEPGLAQVHAGVDLLFCAVLAQHNLQITPAQADTCIAQVYRRCAISDEIASALVCAVYQRRIDHGVDAEQEQHTVDALLHQVLILGR